MKKSMLIGVILMLSLLSVSNMVDAHTLGVDKAQLIEQADGKYQLVSIVPRRLAQFINTPRLPDRCSIEGNPRGVVGDYEVRYTFICDTPLKSGDFIDLPWQREGTMMSVRWLGADEVTRFLAREGEYIHVDLTSFLAGSGTLWEGAVRYTRLGMEHILEGIDHLLFVLALLFVVHGGWKLVQTITAFTIAHSITLALATLGYVNLPSTPVEAAIALSIVFLCVEIIHARRGRLSLTFSYPWVVAFSFGLLHGLGFAGALSEIGLPQNEIPLALLFFNVGVELGQLLFVAVVLVFSTILKTLLGWTHDSRPVRYAEAGMIYAIGILASYWLIERSMGMFVAT